MSSLSRSSSVPSLRFPPVTDTRHAPLPAAPAPTGRTKLASDDSEVDIYAGHQLKPLSNGFVVKLCALFPTKTPKELVDGHALHLAMEFPATGELVVVAR